MHLGFSGFLKQVFSLIKFLESLFVKNSNKTGSLSSILKSPASRNLSYDCL